MIPSLTLRLLLEAELLVLQLDRALLDVSYVISSNVLRLALRQSYTLFILAQDLRYLN
ncbi:hypothetical protein [Acinetobacter sp. 3657]|uniref:hypothetical protein n=1 Tax=Acinetobacter sp. 3657 TaxID=2817764 RepID=UPI0028673933|nr:hypothetical protein [Prolinoborus sp. 3657]